MNTDMNQNQSNTESPCRWRRRKEARPEEILVAALELFTEKGFSATRMLDVAKNAGISKGTLYLYFENKEAIFRAVVQEMISPRLDEFEEMVKLYQGPSDELLRKMIKGWWQSVGETRLSAIPKLITSEAGNFPELAEFFVNTVVKRGRKIFTDVVSRGITSGEFNIYEPRAVARLIIAPLVQLTIWMHSLKPYDENMDNNDFLELHTEFILKSLIKQKGTNDD
jgi:AcrR family transcriptional regulator